MSLKEKINESVNFIKSKYPNEIRLGVILGSGLGILADDVEDAVKIPYSEIPNFPVGTVKGHANTLVLGKMSNVNVVMMKGRFHYYEGFTMQQITFPVRVMAKLGIKEIIITNAGGGVNRKFKPGDLMIITDHINLMGNNPLIGYNEEEGLGPRFPDMTYAYNKELREIALKAGKKLGIKLQQGVYTAVHGCSYETPAEIKMHQVIGTDAVGMSTIPEVIVANQMGLKVLGISCITNIAAGLAGKALNHQEVLEVAEMVKEKFVKLLKEIIAMIAEKS